MDIPPPDEEKAPIEDDCGIITDIRALGGIAADFADEEIKEFIHVNDHDSDQFAEALLGDVNKLLDFLE